MAEESDDRRGFDDFAVLELGDRLFRTLHPELTEAQINERAMIVASHIAHIRKDWKPENRFSEKIKEQDDFGQGE